MAQPLKTAGVKEIDAVRRRVRRQLALGRIERSDHDYLVSHIDMIEARISSMEEVNDEAADH